MKPYAELLEFNQPNPIRLEGFTKARDVFPLLSVPAYPQNVPVWDNYRDPERIIEFAGRADYGPKNTAKLGSDPNIFQRWIDAGHESMIEMAHATFYIECSRVVSHELVRHRLASFQQESQRYVKYDTDERVFGMMDNFYMPEGIEENKIRPSDYMDDDASELMYRSYQESWLAYQQLRDNGVPAQLARYVLPNAMRTRIIMSANLREWRHIVALRLHPRAQPEMQELMQQIYDQLVLVFPRLMAGVLDNGKEVR
jgi:thymidylate synthase (FAD)